MKKPIDILLDYQRKYVRDKSKYKAALFTRRGGKDFSSSYEGVEACVTTPGDEWTVGAPSERQALAHLEKAKTWAEALELYIEDVAIDRLDGPESLLKRAEIKWSNGSIYRAVPGKPETIRGYGSSYILTEMAFYDDPDAVWQAVLPSVANTMDGEKFLRIISTANGKTGRGKIFWELFRDNYFNKKPDSVFSCHRVTLEEAVAQGLGVDIETARKAMNDDVKFDIEYGCEFLDVEDTLLEYDMLSAAESEIATVEAPHGWWEKESTKSRKLAMGIDFGRVNDPTVAWTNELVGGNEITREVLVLKGVPTPEQEQILKPRIQASNRVAFDYTGVGIGMGDHLVEQHGEYDAKAHKFGKVELCTFTADFKRKIFPRLRRKFEAPVSIRIPIDVEVREDLHSMVQVSRNGAYSYVAPRSAAGHSDRCTALALAIHARGDGSSGDFHYQPLDEVFIPGYDVGDSLTGGRTL